MKSEDPKNIPSSFDKKNHLKWKRLFAKKWFFPAVYIAVTAFILTIAWWYQQNQFQQVAKLTNPMETTTQTDSSTGLVEDEMNLPVSQNSEAVPAMGFYDEAASSNEREASLVHYRKTFWPHSGIDFARKDGKTFDVVSTLDGKVNRIEENPVLGYQIEVQHKDGLVTVYQSLKDVRVQKGDSVKKGSVIAQAGQNSFEKDLGNHLHFEIRKNNKMVNPNEFLNGVN
jgi:stage II sporulation protein Q